MWKLVTCEEAPKWTLYPNVSNGYRCGKGGLCKSLWTWHTETINIWTMIVTGLVSVMLAVWYRHLVSPHLHKVLMIHSITVATHCGMSAFFHTVIFLSPRMYMIGRRMDMVGIFGGSVPLAIAVGWFVLPKWLLVINTVVTSMVAAWGIGFMWREVSVNPKTQAMWVARVTLCWMFPLGLKIYQTEAVISVVSLIAGGVVYTLGVPEKWFPGRFDYIGTSHQLMHLSVTTTHIATFLFIVKNGR